MRTTLIRKCIPLLVCACFPAAASAANIGTIQSGDWYDTNTWSTNTTPISNDDVTLNHNVTASGSIIARTINGPGLLTAAGSVLLGGINADSVLINSSISGPLTFLGNGTLHVIDGAGIVGLVTIQDGDLSFGSANALINASRLYISETSTMLLSGANQSINNLDSEGVVSLGLSDLTTRGSSEIKGLINGFGSVIAAAGSTLLLSGNNTGFSGTTIVNSGSTLTLGHNNALGTGLLTLNNASLANSGDITINNDITLLTNINSIGVSQNTRFEITGDINGNGSLWKNGLGELVLSGTTTLNGELHLEEGTLNLASTGVITGGVAVSNGASLSGTGNLGSYLVIMTGSTLAPGNSIGTLNVAGPIVFRTGSNFNVELDSSGASDLLNVAGAVTIQSGSTLNIDGAAGTYGPSTTYTLINAVGGVNGMFSTINSNLAFLNPQVFVNGNLLQLTLTGNSVSFADVTRSYNQRNAALALMSVGAGTLATAVTSLDGNTARSAFGQLSGEVHASAQGALVDDTDFVRSAVTQRLYQPDGNAVWFKGSSIHGYTDRNSNTDSTSRHMNGGLVGSDRTIGDGNWTAGVFGGYGDTNFNTQRSRADIKTVHLGAYAGRAYDNLQLKLGAGYAYHRLDTSRNLGFGTFTGRDKADYDAHSLQAFADVGYRIKSGDGSIEPFLNLAQVHLVREGFNERGDDAALRVSREQSNVTLGTIGVRLDQPLTTSSTLPLRLQGSLGYRHAEGDVTPKSEARLAGGNSFDVRGNPIARQAAVYDIGVYSQLSPTLSAGINYRGQNGDNTTIHAANLNVTWLF